MKIKTEIQAVIWKINVEVGQKINIDDVVVILESMKMEIEVKAGLDGTVNQIIVEQGQSVEEGDLILEVS